ncbi:conserved hypothetical protein [Candidatus Sulfobium mesophilum]|uniref:Uncharacterized protein n=1 Tax=Candidatus Sulfobium mesophilum TaxID=2016548 RepID=A0A2U3QL08_9BACT|nr:conserved hypothetical protein [Candidatus Sulfobium mesophilum]
MKLARHQSRLYLIAVTILLTGLGSAILIYLTAVDNPNDALGYEMAGGNVYPVTPEDSKMYMHNLELYGGKINVLANELTRWFVGLWHGKSLAFTIAFITIFASFCLFFIASHLSSGSGVRDEHPTRQ